MVLIILTLYGVNYFIFERLFFFNELLSLIGFYYFITYSFTRDFKFRVAKSYIYKLVISFILLCFFYALISLFIKTNWYYYFRNLSIIYSAFAFFIGYNLYHEQYLFFNKIRNSIYGYALVAFSIGNPNLIDRNAYSYWFALLQKNWKLKAVFGFITLHILYVIAFTSLTVVIILIGTLGLLFIIKSYAQFKLVAVLSFCAFLTIFILAIPYLKMYNDNGYLLFGDVVYVYSKHPWFSIDHNNSWRLLFWYRTIVEPFPQCLLGIGIGTPILPYLPEITTSDLLNTDEYIAHVIGTHNTFVTIWVRFGILTAILIALIYRMVLREFFVHKRYYLSHNNDVGLFLSFIVLSFVGLFNLLIETPTLSALYWVSLGFVTKAIDNRRHGKNEV